MSKTHFVRAFACFQILPLALVAIVPHALAQNQQQTPGLVDSSTQGLSGQVNYMVPPAQQEPQTLGGNPQQGPQSSQFASNTNTNQKKDNTSRRGSGLGLTRLGTGLLGRLGMMGMGGMGGGGGGGGGGSGKNSGGNNSSLASRNASGGNGAGGSYGSTGATADNYRERWWNDHGRQTPGSQQ